jgi:hypothetical protein
MASTWIRSAIVGGIIGSSLSWAEDASYLKEIETWRLERQDSLQKDDSWLTVAGLYWLREGENSIGTGLENDFVLPEDSGPGHVGSFTLSGTDVRFQVADGVTATHKGERIQTARLEPGEKNAVAVGRLSMWVHLSGERRAIRLRDLESPIRKKFHGLEWFPVDPAYRITARFTPYPQPKAVEILNMLGDIEKYESPGDVTFVLQGQEIRMAPVSNSRGGLWLIFRDGTSGKETYPAARFLHAEPPSSGEVVLDFNKAYNPPCAFNPFTTCPMPAKENRLTLRVEAGEKDYKKPGGKTE